MAALVSLAKPGHAQDDATSEPALDVSSLKGGITFGEHTYAHKDETGTLTLPDMLRPGADVPFVRETRREPSFGFTSSPVWLRFDIVNRGPREQHWLLELAFPHLDHIDLYEVHPDGTQKHWTAGDTLPFAARQLDHPNFLFALDTAPGASVRYYLRAKTTGALRVPLVAWLSDEFVGHESRSNLLLWMFYGAIAVMTLYNLGTALMLKNVEYLYYAFVVCSIGLAVFTMSGQTYQYLVPTSPALANRALAVSFALALISVQLYTRNLTARLPVAQHVRAIYRYTMPLSCVLLLVTALSPPVVGIRCALVGFLSYVPVGSFKLRAIDKLKRPELRFYTLSWYCLVIALPTVLLAHANVLPPFPLFLWAGHLGCVAHIICTALALPARINLMSDHLAGLNAQLSQNVSDLQLTLSRAEEANEKARRATRVKDEFLATMSHELRTPLNSIINVPLGLLEDFKVERGATCAVCRARYLLEGEEQLSTESACEDCGGVGTLHEGALTRFAGDAARAARFLQKIEKSGKHLLQMVNDVLDSSKMDAGRLELKVVPLDMESLLREAVDEVSQVEETRDIRISLAPDAALEREPCVGDPLRLKQVLLNLLANAIKFSEPYSAINVTWRRGPEHDLISIEDQGIGIDPADHERVFESFEQVHKGDTRKYGGTGLGLSISRKLVRMHGGELWVESQRGSGSRFILRIPRPAASTEPTTYPLTGTG
ncbi:MAG: ATPase protein [Pseudomonadota bacterium]